MKRSGLQLSLLILSFVILGVAPVGEADSADLAFKGAGSAQSDDVEGVIRIMTYNIRMDTPRDGINQWRHRRDAVAEMMVGRYNADIIATQEAFINQLNDLSRRLPGYDWVGVGRQDARFGNEYNAIFYRTERFRLLGTNTFWLSRRPNRPGSRSWDSGIARIVTWARFRDRQTGKEFVVFNTHFDRRGERARIQSTRMLARKMPLIAGNTPYIFLGDINVTEQNPLYPMILDLTGMADARYVSETGHEGPTATFNYWTRLRDPETRIDYIFVTDGIRVLNHRILDDRFDGRFPSDHLPLMSDIVLDPTVVHGD